MYDFSKALGDAAKRARSKMGLTQSQVAELVDIDVRTVMNIENYKANPKMEVLFPYIRKLEIDPCEIFYPGIQRDDAAIYQLRFLTEDCSGEEAEALSAVIKAVLSVMRSKNPIKIE